jgi:hypothetical protein
MHFNILATLIYGGPDQIMTVTSGLASILGILLIFWHKAMMLFMRIVQFFKPSAQAAAATSENNSKDNQ